jgi:hypothetical protein
VSSVLRWDEGEAPEGICCDEQQAASGGKPLEAEKPRRAAALGFWRKPELAGVESSRRAKPRRRRSGAEGSGGFARRGLGGPRANVTEGTGLERDRKALRGGKALEGKAHERYRHETRPDGPGRSKPSGGCETLKTEGVGLGKPEGTGLP